ncbi:hypothetical protein PMAYCL1PPCAC_30795, partial [Pristionchus mayeri]
RMRFFLLLFASTFIFTSSKDIPPFEAKDNYCPCGIVDGKFEGWDPKQIWLNIMIVFDTSASMADDLEEAKSMVTSFVSLMGTNRSAEYYTIIGVITASDKVKVVYPLNMKSTDNLNEVKATDADHATFVHAMEKSILLLDEICCQHHRQDIIYYLTKTTPMYELELEGEGEETPLLDFKRNGGIFMVNDFGSTTNPKLKILASPAYYFSDMSKNYANNLAVFCEANCFCDDYHFESFNNNDWSIRTRANRGCFQMDFNKTQSEARESCRAHLDYLPGALVSIHDQDKEFFVNSVAAAFYGPKKPKSKYWIGLENNGTEWNWDDKSVNPYSSWDDDQPDMNEGKSMCAFATQTTGFNVNWYAENCGQLHDFVCELAPFSVGNKGIINGFDTE